MISNYSTYILDRELDKLIYIIESKNESIIDILDKIKNWLSKLINKFSLDQIIKQISKLNFIYCLLVLSLMISAFNMSKTNVISKVSNSNLEYKDALISDLEIIVVSNDTVKIDPETRKYLEEIAMSESSGDWTKINKLGYLGKFQFGRIALKDIGLNPDTLNKHNFKKNPLIWSEKEQDHAMVKLLKNNVKYLGKYLKEYSDKTINKVEITRSGLLAASHLVGASKVKKYLKSGGKYIPVDGNGTSVEDYLIKFANHKINI